MPRNFRYVEGIDVSRIENGDIRSIEIETRSYKPNIRYKVEDGTPSLI